MEKRLDKNQYIIGTILLVAYLLFNGILLLGHEMWRDEANVWLIARDMTPLQLFREIKYQGHPCLWYLIAMPFAKLGLPFQTLSVISFIVMGAGAAVLVYRAPFHPLTKAVCLLSPMMSYYYPVVARNYCLIALLVILLAYFYPQRNEKKLLYGLLLGLLVQADMIALATAGLISLMWLWECLRQVKQHRSFKKLLSDTKGLWIPFVSVLLLAAQFFQVSDSPEYELKLFSAGEMVREIKYFSYHILNRMTGMGESFSLLLIVLFAVAGVLLSLKIKNVWPSVVMAGAFLFEVLFSIMVYQLHIWHYIALCYSLIWCFWLGLIKPGKKKADLTGRVIAEGLLVILGVTMFIRWNAPEESSSLSNAWNGLYSDGVHVAEYIKEHIEPEELILSTDVTEASTVQAYLGKEYGFYYAGTGELTTYANYTEEQKKQIAYEELYAWVLKQFPEKEYFYLLKSPTSCVTDFEEQTVGAEVCYQTKEMTARGEEYSLYKIRVQE